MTSLGECGDQDTISNQQTVFTVSTTVSLVKATLCPAKGIHRKRNGCLHQLTHASLTVIQLTLHFKQFAVPAKALGTPVVPICPHFFQRMPQNCQLVLPNVQLEA